MYKYLFLISIACASLPAAGQTVTQGREDKKAEVNFLELAKYYGEHPLPLNQKPIFDEDEEEATQIEQPEPDPALVHLIQRSGARYVSGGATGLALLPVSASPADTFLSTESDGTAIPPDTHGEVDGTYCVTAINTNIHIQHRTGTNVSNLQLGAFWSHVLATPDAAFDPRAHYDPHYKRWIMVTDAYGQTDSSMLLIGVSKTSDPTGAWWQYSLRTDPTGASWLDYPDVGFNNRWVAVTGNYFQNTGSGATGAVVFVFNYDSLMNGSAPYTKISESSLFTISPALTYDTAEANLYMLENYNGTSGKLALLKISGTTNSPAITTVGYPTTTQHWHNGGSADFVTQFGSSDKIQAGDDRISHSVQRNGYLWCSHTVFLPDPGTVNRCSVMWWQVDTNANPIQNGLIDDPTTPSFIDYSSIAVNSKNDALIGFSYTNANTHPCATYALHLHTDPADSMRPMHIYRHGQASYFQNFGGSQNRWGDYSNTCVDPVNNVDFWTIQESVPASPANYWDTWWANVQLCPAASSFSKNADSVYKFQNDTLTFTGTAPTGSTITWSFSGGTAVPGTGAGPQAVSWTTTGWKAITLSITDSGCTSSYTDNVLVKSTVGITTLIAPTKDVEILPNPNDGSFHILLQSGNSATVLVVITDMEGRQVYSQSLVPNGNDLAVHTGNLAAGNYIVIVNPGDGEIRKKITISR